MRIGEPRGKGEDEGVHAAVLRGARAAPTSGAYPAGYRNYGDEAVQRLEFIDRARAAGPPSRKPPRSSKYVTRAGRRAVMFETSSTGDWSRSTSSLSISACSVPASPSSARTQHRRRRRPARRSICRVPLTNRLKGLAARRNRCLVRVGCRARGSSSGTRGTCTTGGSRA